MKKVLIIISILLLAGAGYFTYEKWVKHANLTNWSFIPADASIVLEGTINQDLQTFQGYPFWSIIEQSDGFQGFRQGLSFLDSINGEGGFKAIFENTPVLTSIHKVSSSDLDFLFVVDLQNISQNTFANAAIGRLEKSGFRFKTRNYNDFKISEISNQGKTFTFIFFKNFFLGSFTPYLVEDAVRVLSEADLPPFKERFTELTSTGVEGISSIYVNYEKSGELMNAFLPERVNFPMTAGNYELLLDSSFMQLSGFSYAIEDGWFSTHQSQPATFDMAEVIPNNTGYLLHLTSNNMSEWKTQQIDYLRSNNAKVKQLQDSLKAQFDFNVDQIFDLVDQEIGVVTLESPRARDQQKLLILEVKDIQESLSFFSQLTQRIAASRGDTVYAESYSDNEIRFLSIRDFPSTLLGDQASGFDQCFYLSHRNYLLFSNDLQELKKLIVSIQSEETWGKSIQMNDFLSRSNNTANVSLFVNIPRAWNQIASSLKPEWTEHFDDNAATYRSLDMAAFQFSYQDGRHYTNYTFSQPAKRITSIPKTNADDGIRFASNLTTKPFLVRTHAHKNFDILLQDSTNTVYYLDSDQNARWSENIGEPIVSNIYPIDYYKNGKLQYAFATTTQVHIMDRTGAPIPGFPKTLPSSPTIAHLNLIDYDKSRNYRMAITDSDGNVYLTDKDLKLLTGWNPKSFNRAALTPLTHNRLGRRDVLLSLQRDGNINALNRRGQALAGFPFSINQSISKDFFLRPSNSLGSSTITVLTTGGELVEITLEGGLVKRDQLIKTRADASFRLIPDTGGESFIIVRQEENTYEVLDDTGNLLFKKDYLSGNDILIQYYRFGAGKDLVIFIDRSNDTLYIYDKSGNLVTGNPLNAQHEVSLIYSGAKRAFQVFTTWGSNLERYSFNF